MEIKENVSYIDMRLDGASCLSLATSHLRIFLFSWACRRFIFQVVAGAVILWKMTRWNEQKQPSANIVQLWAYANAMGFMFRLKVPQKKLENERAEMGHEVQETV